MTAHYTHIGIETAQKAVALLPSLTRVKPKEDVSGSTDKNMAEFMMRMDEFSDVELDKLANKITEIKAMRMTSLQATHSDKDKADGNLPRPPHRPRPARRRRLRPDPAAVTGDQGLDVRLPEPQSA